jgi:hypothetical protein
VVSLCGSLSDSSRVTFSLPLCPLFRALWSSLYLPRDDVEHNVDVAWFDCVVLVLVVYASVCVCVCVCYCG